MREYASKPQNISRTPDDTPKASRQPPISEILQAYRNGSPAENTILNKPVEIENWQQTGSTANTKTNSTNVIQQKIRLNGVEYQHKEDDNEKIKAAGTDKYIRRYDNEEEMRSHFAGNPSNYGLIKNIALWYKIPYLAGAGKKFFVLGESHAAVRGLDIARESNIPQESIFYEGYLDSWSVTESGKRYDSGNKSPDEILSKLLRALELLLIQLLIQNGDITLPAPSGDEIPKIPEGQKSTRKSVDGTYRLVIKGEGGKEKFWTPGATEMGAEPNDFDVEKEVLLSISTMMPKVIEDDDPEPIKKACSNIVNENFSGMEINEKIKMVDGLRDHFFKSIKKPNRRKEYKKADDFRDDFMLNAINNAPNGRFDFAAIGDAHLRNIKDALNDGIPSISMADFYSSKYSENAVDIPD